MLEPHVAKRVAPSTLYRYQAAALAFSCWARREGYAPHTVEEWDDLLVEDLYENGHLLTRSKFQSVVAAAEYFFPLLRRKSVWSHQVIDGWNVNATIHHTVPWAEAVLSWWPCTGARLATHDLEWALCFKLALN